MTPFQLNVSFFQVPFPIIQFFHNSWNCGSEVNRVSIFLSYTTIWDIAISV